MLKSIFACEMLFAVQVKSSAALNYKLQNSKVVLRRRCLQPDCGERTVLQEIVKQEKLGKCRTNQEKEKMNIRGGHCDT